MLAQEKVRESPGVWLLADKFILFALVFVLCIFSRNISKHRIDNKIYKKYFRFFNGEHFLSALTSLLLNQLNNT